MGLEEITCGENIDKIMTLTFRVWVEKKINLLGLSSETKKEQQARQEKNWGDFLSQKQ